MFGNSMPGFEPITLKSLLKYTCAWRGYYELLLYPRGEEAEQVDFNRDLMVVGSNPGREFPKNCLSI